jgi:molybdate transport system permease protein
MAAGLGAFGAVILFASSMTRQMHTLPLAIYAAIPTPCGTAAVVKLSLVSSILAVAGLLRSDMVARWMLRLPGW